MATPSETRRLSGAGAGRLVSAGFGLSALFLAIIFATRDVPSGDESVAKWRDQQRKMMMQHYASSVATDETVHDNAKLLLTGIGITSTSNN
jgi:hypothetical protein